MAILRLDELQVENLRFTVFPTESVSMAVRYWESLVGSPPDDQHSQPNKGMFTEEGLYEDTKLRVQIAPQRIDWLLYPDFQKMSGTLPTFGSYESWSQRFFELILKWLPECPSVNRMAYACILLHPSDNLEAAHKLLKSLLPIVSIGDGNFSDFSFRINRPRAKNFGNEEVIFNRLSSWSVMNLISGNFRIPSEIRETEQIPNIPIHQIESQSCIRLESDINTTHNRTESFSENELPHIFETLVQYSNEIASDGDIA